MQATSLGLPKPELTDGGTTAAERQAYKDAWDDQIEIADANILSAIGTGGGQVDSAAGWTAANPILNNNQLGYESDTGKFKLGDGVTAWNSLAYYFDGSAGSGDVTGGSVSADGEVAVYDGITGKVIKRSNTFTGIAKVTAGVLGVCSDLADVSYIPASQKNAANGVAPLDADSKVPSANLPAGLPSEADWLLITSKPHKTIGEAAPYDTLANALAAPPPAGTTLIIPPGLAASDRTLDADAVLPPGVTLQVHQGSPIIINAHKRLTVKGYISECNHQIFDDQNTYDYSTRTITTITGAPSAPVFTLASNGLVEGDQVFFAADTADHNYANVSDISGDTFRLKYPNGNYVTGAFTANNFTIALKEAFGVKFINSTTTHVRPEWWGITGTPATDAISFNHAIHNSFLVTDGVDTTGLRPISLSPGDYKVAGRLYPLSGTILTGCGAGFGGPFMYKTIIYVYDSDPTVGSFMYLMDMGEINFRDFAINAMPGITCSKGFELTGGQWKTNGTKFERVAVVGFSDWGIYCTPPDFGMMTRLQNCYIGSNGNGIRINTDSEVFDSNFVGNGEGIGIQSAGAQIRNCLIEVWGKGISLGDGGNVISGCLLKQIGNAETSIGAGIWLESTASLNQRIIGNIFSTSYNGIYSEGEIVQSQILGNSFENMGWGAEGYGINASGYQSSVITGNGFINCTYGPFNKTRIVQANAFPGQIYDNIGVDVGVGSPVELTPASTQTWRPMAYFGNKFITTNTATTNIGHFFRSAEENRQFSVALGDSYTTIAQWMEAATGNVLQLYGYSVGSGWDATNRSHQTATFTVFSSPAQVNDAVYLSDDQGGYRDCLKPMGLKLYIGTPSVGNTVVAEYWDGYEWVTLSTSGADIFDLIGWRQVTWMPPPVNTYTYNTSADLLTVNATSKVITNTNGDSSWLRSVPNTYRGHVKVGDWIITTGFVETGNNGKWKVLAVDRFTITVDDPGDDLVTESTPIAADVNQAGWTYANLNALGLPGTPPSASGYWMRLRVTVAAGGQCTVGDGSKYAQYSFLGLKEGDFGPFSGNDLTEHPTINFRCFNGGIVEDDRTIKDVVRELEDVTETPSLAGGSKFTVASAAPREITKFIDTVPGKKYELEFANGNTKLIFAASTDLYRTDGNAEDDITFTDGSTAELKVSSVNGTITVGYSVR